MPAKAVPQVPRKSKKVTQFEEELADLEDRYQYKVVPYLVYTNAGVFPRMKVVDVIPKKRSNGELKVLTRKQVDKGIKKGKFKAGRKK